MASQWPLLPLSASNQQIDWIGRSLDDGWWSLKLVCLVVKNVMLGADVALIILVLLLIHNLHRTCCEWFYLKENRDRGCRGAQVTYLISAYRRPVATNRRCTGGRGQKRRWKTHDRRNAIAWNGSPDAIEAIKGSIILTTCCKCCKTWHCKWRRRDLKGKWGQRNTSCVRWRDDVRCSVDQIYIQSWT
jgi:hypothetical protein